MVRLKRTRQTMAIDEKELFRSDNGQIKKNKTNNDQMKKNKTKADGTLTNNWPD